MVETLFWNFFPTIVSLSYHLCVECFSQPSFVSEIYTKSSAVADFVYTSESNESCEQDSKELSPRSLNKMLPKQQVNSQNIQSTQLSKFFKLSKFSKFF